MKFIYNKKAKYIGELINKNNIFIKDINNNLKTIYDIKYFIMNCKNILI